MASVPACVDIFIAFQVWGELFQPVLCGDGQRGMLIGQPLILCYCVLPVIQCSTTIYCWVHEEG